MDAVLENHIEITELLLRHKGMELNMKDILVVKHS